MTYPTQEFSFWGESMGDVGAFIAATGNIIKAASIKAAHGHVDVSFVSDGTWDHFRAVAQPWRMIRDTLSLDSEET